VSKFAYPWVIF